MRQIDSGDRQPGHPPHVRRRTSGYDGPLPDPADVLTRIERFTQSKGGGVDPRGGGYTLRLAATGAPIARLKPTGSDDSMQVFYWCHRGKWSKTGPMGGAILPLDEALAFIASDPIFWIWT